ncbi:hypothetical protein Taro_046833 [Colocasia esculenta]|uniref:Endonuclease/exonuclease/phosphatase domain-containing protein n=1 Tax=Colocasia esculenta TaxID=4460 RepID=A0A843WZW6_COLES|nr:hypothetical protein [Colocasia esculenta]
MHICISEHPCVPSTPPKAKAKLASRRGTMGNSHSHAPAKEDEEELKESVASGSSSGRRDILKVGAAVAGVGFLTWGSWHLLSGGAAGTDKYEKKWIRVGERLKGKTGGSDRRWFRPDVFFIPWFEQLMSIGSKKTHMKGVTVASGSSSGRHMLKVDEAVAGVALLARGCWHFLFRGAADNISPGTDEKVLLQILSYNVWSEDVMLQERMEAIGVLIQEKSPDLICFQEVTPNIYKIFENSNWWQAYSSSVPPEMAYRRNYFCMQLSKLPACFSQTRIGLPIKRRELCIAQVDAGKGKSTLAFATVHLVCPNPHPCYPHQRYSAERIAQAQEALSALTNYPNVVFGGDMNWDEEVDGPVPLPPGWVDAWEKKRPGEDGWTFDTMANPMLWWKPPLRKRLDRFLCCLKDFSISSIELIGTRAIPELYYSKEKKVGKMMVPEQIVLPLLPSDHFGLLLTIESHK